MASTAEPCWHIFVTLLTMPCLSNLCQVIRLRKKLSGAADAVRGLFGVAANQDEVVAKLEKMQVNG
jgi:hypothetical protein